MKTWNPLKTEVIVIVVVICMCVVGRIGLITAKAMPDIHWSLGGRVVDSDSNGIPDVNITAAGQVNVTAFNKVFRTKPEEFHQTLKTDKDGNFSLQCISYGFDVLFQKDGYADFDTIFGYYPGVPGGTNRVFTVQLLKVQR